MAVSRGESISGYNPAFARGAKVFAGQVKYQIITSAVANSGVVYGLTHTLGVTPVVKIFSSIGPVGHLRGVATSANSIGEATASAASTTKVYFAGAKNTRFTVFLMG